VLDPTAALVQPAALARALTALARELGVKVFERSPVRVVKAGEQVTVETTTDGVVRAERVVLALNAWMAHLPELRRFVAVLSSDIVATERVPETVRRAFSLQRGLGVANSRLSIDYYRDTADGRVVFGSGGGTVGYGGRVGASFDHSGRQIARVAHNLHKLLPALRDVPIARGWSGPVDRSYAGLPRFESLAGGDPRVLYGVGYSGNGVAAAALGGRILASLALQRDDRWAAAAAALARVPRGQFPPEPIRYVGARLIRAAVLRKEDAEDSGAGGAWLERRLARLAPSGITGGQATAPSPRRIQDDSRGRHDEQS
jgi:glycine/D-amino acid oxidase-like deaminating enzyme